LVVYRNGNLKRKKQEKQIMKKQNLVLLTGFLVGVVACGSNSNNETPQAPKYIPNEVQPVPPQPTSYNYQSTEQWMIAQLQGLYGNITTNAASSRLGLGAGVHTWSAVYDRLVSVANMLVSQGTCDAYTSYSVGSILSRIDLNCLRRNLQMSSQSSIGVRYAKDPYFVGYTLAHTIDQILNTFYSSYNYMYGYWGFGGYPYYYVPVNYYGTGFSVGVSYNSGNGLSIGLSGSYRR
jgi:hypothetical protein